MLIIEKQLKESSGQAYEYSSTVNVIPVSFALDICKKYTEMMLNGYIDAVADQTTICDNNHHRTITEEEIRNFKIDLI